MGCSYFLNGASAGYRYDGTLPSYTGPRIGSCAPWLDSSEWTDEVKENLKQLALSSMDSMQNWFFWTWRIGASSRTGQVNSPLWSYKLGLERGYMPTDPRTAAGSCGNSDPRTTTTFTPHTQNSITAAYRAAHPFPPTNIVDATGTLASYPETGAPVIMPSPEFKGFSVPTTQSGTWANDYAPVAGCTYPDPWNGVGVAVPACATGERKRFVKEPQA
jgi:glucan 1,3-beta-glucosidase